MLLVFNEGVPISLPLYYSEIPLNCIYMNNEFVAQILIATNTKSFNKIKKLFQLQK